jgi:hypothetical protein
MNMISSFDQDRKASGGSIDPVEWVKRARALSLGSNAADVVARMRCRQRMQWRQSAMLDGQADHDDQT